MLLPSALSCDPAHGAAASSARLQAALFASPPASPPAQSSGGALGFGNIVATCRSLQSLLGAPPAFAHNHHHHNNNTNGLMIFTPPAVSREASCPRDDNGGSRDPSQLPTPPLAHAPCPLKLRLRSRKATEPAAPADHLPVTTRKKIAKRAPPRGANKRRRATADSDSDSDLDVRGASSTHTAPSVAPPTSSTKTTTTTTNANANANANADPEAPAQPLHTPKRARIAPAVVPLGLERSDFHALHEPGRQAGGGPGTDVEVEADGEAWSAEDDRILVELVLEKLRLSREDWEDCARSLGRDRACLGRRWKSLMLHGDVGLRSTRSSTRRARLHSTWR
ncbi:hypothetical protein RB595_005851 [Gaeumannomyces hyphopodioides]